jgi:hypothetical protein
MATRMLATPVWWFYVFWLPDYLGRDRGFTLREIGLFGWIPFLTVDLGKLLGGALSDRLLAKGYTATVARKSVMAGGAIAMLGVGQPGHVRVRDVECKHPRLARRHVRAIDDGYCDRADGHRG